MLKKIFLIRHAEAAPAGAGLKDFDRSLTPNGFRDAVHVGKYLYKKNIIPEVFLSSSSLRTRQTSEEIATQIKFEQKKISYLDKLYEPSVRELFEQINAINRGTVAILVTHNPSVTYLAEYLTNEAVGNMDPGTALEIDFAIDDWAAITHHSGELMNTFVPT